MGDLEMVATFHGPMPTGVTVSHSGRIFVCFPKWGDKVDFTVAELRDGRPIAFPDEEINRAESAQDARHLISVQSVVIDPSDRLWIVDTGSIQFGPTAPGGPKLVGVDLRTNRVLKTVTFPPEVALPTSYLNDVRFDLRRGDGGLRVPHRFVGQGAERHHRRRPGDRNKLAAAARPPDHQGRPRDAGPCRGPAGDGASSGR